MPHAAAPDDALDMIDSEVRKKFAVVGPRLDDQVGLFANVNEPIRLARLSAAALRVKNDRAALE